MSGSDADERDEWNTFAGLVTVTQFKLPLTPFDAIGNFCISLVDFLHIFPDVYIEVNSTETCSDVYVEMKLILLMMFCKFDIVVDK